MSARKEKQIERIAALDQGKFLAEFRLRQPVVLSGGLASWPDTLFDMERLASRFGAQPVSTYRLPAETPTLRMSSIKSNFYHWSDEKNDREHLRKWTFGKFVTALRRGGAHYCMANGTKNSQLRDLLAAEAGEFGCIPMDGTKREPARCEFFFGSEKTGPGLHHDGAVESFLCQLVGSKQVNVFSPADIPYLYPADSWLAPTGHFSAVADSFNTDHDRFPLFSLATTHRCQIDSGDILYLPPHWYHDTSPRGPSATMTIRNAPPAEIWGTRQERDRLKKAASALGEYLRRFSPVAQATYSELLSYDLKSGPRSQAKDGGPPATARTLQRAKRKPGALRTRRPSQSLRRGKR